MKKRLPLLLIPSLILACVLLLVVTRRGSGEQEQEIVIEYWTHEDASRAALEERLTEEFMEANVGIAVHRVTHDSTDQLNLIDRAFVAGRGPDLFNMTIESEYPLIARGYVAPVDLESAGYGSLSALEDTYIDGVFDAVKKDGSIYGLPLEYTNWCLYINKRIFREVGLDPERDYPRTWEEVRDISEKLAIHDGTVLVRRGFDFRYPFYLNFLVPMAEQLGGSLVSEDGKTALEGEDAWIEVLTFMRDWGPNGLNLGSPTYTNARHVFSGDDASAAMALSGLYQEKRIAKQNPAFFESGDWMVVPFPHFANSLEDVSCCAYAHYYMVNAKSDEKVKKAAWKYVGFLLSHGKEYLDQVGILQPTKALVSSTARASIPYSDVFMNDLSRSHIVYSGPKGTEIQNLLSQAVESVMLSGASPEKAYMNLRTGVQELLDEHP